MVWLFLLYLTELSKEVCENETRISLGIATGEKKVSGQQSLLVSVFMLSLG
jgi:hypothetical protein